MAESKAAGPDGPYPRLLKILQVEAMSVGCNLFECCFRSTVAPQCWRGGEVTPLLKAGKDPAVMSSNSSVCFAFVADCLIWLPAA